jgi:glycosylphosphatidylinositol transamidase
MHFVNQEKSPHEAMVATKAERVRLLPRLIMQLLRRASFVSMLCYLAGVVGILLLPAIAKETYVDENALSPGET